MAAFASFVRERLAEVSGTLAPLWARRDDIEVLPAGRQADAATVGAARHLAMVIMGAAAPFAATSHARARLLRQAYASGLLSARETERAETVLAITAGTSASSGSTPGELGASG
jgi:hypothetical protein